MARALAVDRRAIPVGPLLAALLVDRLPAGDTPRDRRERAVRLDDGADRQVQLAPPRHVGDVAERADHRDAAALRGIGERVRLDRHAHAEQRRHHVAPEQRLIPRIVGMRDERDAGGNQLRPGRFDFNGGAEFCRLRRHGKLDPVIRTRKVAIFELRLRHRRLEVDIPERRRLRLVRQPAVQETEERELRDTLRARRDRRVRHRPVDRQAEVSPEVLEDLLVFRGEPVAELDEIGPGDRNGMLRRLIGHGERRIVRQRRIAAHAVVVLHPPFGRQPVVVPPHRIEDGLAAHPLEARDDVRVCTRRRGRRAATR